MLKQNKRSLYSYIPIIQRIIWAPVFIVLILVIVRMINPSFLSGYSEWNELPAFAAAILLLVVLLPGSLQRAGLHSGFARFLAAFRRTLGILMYLAALMHALFLLDYIPVFSDGEVGSFDLATASGLVALTVLLPVLLTSNNASVRALGKFWKWVQRLTYFALPLATIHFWQSDERLLAALYAFFIVVIISSYIVLSFRRGNSFFRTLGGVVVTGTLASLFTFVSLKYLYFNPRTLALQKEFVETQARIEELVQMHESLIPLAQEDLTELEQVRERFAEFEQIIAQEKALAEEKARAEEAARVAAEVERKRVEEAARLAKLQEEQRLEQERIEQERIAAEEAAEAARIAALSDYVDGTFTGVGNYSTDKGKKTERIDVKLTISKDIVKSVEIISHAKATKSIKYVGKFNKDIAGVVVGRDIDSLDVHGIGGASDTSTGFRTALASIKSQARQ